MADSTILPIYRHRLVQPDGTTTPEFYRFFQALERLQQSSDTALQDQITQIAFKLGSPDGTVGNIPFVDISDFLTSASNVVGNASIASFGALASGVVVLTLVNDVADPTGGTPGTTFYYGVDQTGAKGWYPLDGDHVLLESLGGATYTTLQEFVNVMHSPGLITGGAITDLGAGNIRVLAGTIMVRIADDDVSTLTFADFDQTDFVIPADQDTRFFGVVYNAGTPIVEVRTVFDWDKDTEIPLGSAVRFNGTTILLSNAYKTGDPITNIIQRFDAIGPAQRDNAEGGLLLGETGTRNVTLSAGRIWARLTDFGVTAKNSSVDTMVSGFFDGVSDLVLTTGVTQWDNLQYNDTTAGTLVTLDNNKYANLWFFIATEGDQYGFIYGTNQYNTLAAASTEGVPFFLTTNFFAQTLLLGRLIFQKSAATASVIESAFTRVFTTQPVSDHNQLTNLQGGTAPSEFFHLTSSQHTVLAAAAANQSANTAFMGPTSGAAAAPAFRVLVSDDIPTTLSGDRSFSDGLGVGGAATTGMTILNVTGRPANRADIVLNGQVTDADRATIAAIWGAFPASASAEKRHAFFAFNLDGATTNNRGGAISFAFKADNSTTITENGWFNGGGLRIGSASIKPASHLHLNNIGTAETAVRWSNGATLRALIGVAETGGQIITGSAVGDLLLRSQAEVRISAGGATAVMRMGGAAWGMFGTAPVAKQTVTGSRGGNAALASLLTALAAYGLITDSTTA